MNNLIKTAFPNCTSNNCLEQTNSDIIVIYDDAVVKKCLIHQGDVSELEYPFFRILNPNKYFINFLAIDNCILFDCDGLKCDFATFYEKIFYFVELKRALGLNEIYRSEKKEKALLQLKATLTRFLAAINFTGHTLKACLCVGYDCPSPAAAASDLNNLVEFINDYNTDLIEGNEIAFA